ncbi:MAG TPA: outer membrane lipoprotein carrier protein LolA [Ignavibacteria bacterium]|nr:outer membrane lipoprotein carrier protein LolA [Ignavibacteria bacterium]
MKNLLKIFLLTFLFFQLFIGVGSAQSLLKKVQNKFNSIKDISADFVQQTNGRESLKGKIKFKQKDKIRIELGNIIIVSDGKTNRSYNKKRNKIIISSVDKENPSVFSLRKFIEEYPQLSNVSEKREKNTFILKIVPKKDSGLNFNYTELYFNTAYQIKEIFIKGAEYGSIMIMFINYKENNGFKDSIFKITPSKGTETIDLR